MPGYQKIPDTVIMPSRVATATGGEFRPAKPRWKKMRRSKRHFWTIILPHRSISFRRLPVLSAIKFVCIVIRNRSTSLKPNGTASVIANHHQMEAVVYLKILC
jgi:hypothetical protein